jgi:hypothetical protein
MVANALSMTLVGVIGAVWADGHELARGDVKPA